MGPGLTTDPMAILQLNPGVGRVMGRKLRAVTLGVGRVIGRELARAVTLGVGRVIGRELARAATLGVGRVIGRELARAQPSGWEGNRQRACIRRSGFFAAWSRSLMQRGGPTYNRSQVSFRK